MRGEGIDRFFFDGLGLALKSHPELVEEIAIRLVGGSRHMSPLIESFIERGVVSSHPPVPFDQVGNVLAHANGGLSWQGGYHQYRGMIVQKFFEYFATNTPMFIVGRPDGEMGNMLRRYSLGVATNPNSSHDVANDFVRFHNAVKAGEFDYSSCPDRLRRQFDRHNQAKLLAQVFDCVAGQKS